MCNEWRRKGVETLCALGGVLECPSGLKKVEKGWAGRLKGCVRVKRVKS